LNLLGSREPAVYGTVTLAEVDARLLQLGAALGVEIECAQHNGEGDLIDAIHSWRDGRVQGALVNAGAYTHTSLAIRDALLAVGVPVVEVHLSNIFSREPERRQSHIAPVAVGLVCGFGAESYELALRALVTHLARG
jgi:3-dehydroquinate dehydratase-2